MGKGIDITHYKQENNIYYYGVSKGNNCPDFYIGIDCKNKTILFYRTNDFINPLMVVDPLEEYVLDKTIPGINKHDAALAIIQAYKALKNNYFPKYIGIQS